MATEQPGPPADIAWALARLRATHGRARIDRLVDSIGCSRKHLTVRFTREFGMPPKAMARVLRFGHAIRCIRRGDVASWADLAARCGYADQSHLSRDFRVMSGDSPRALIRRALPDDAGFID
jgi:AraC-like DNA-binding protein